MDIPSERKFPAVEVFESAQNQELVRRSLIGHDATKDSEKSSLYKIPATFDLDEKLLAISIGLHYLEPDEVAISQHANPSRDSAPSAFEILAERFDNDTTGSDGADETQRIDSEAESLVSWAKREGYQIEKRSWENLVSSFVTFLLN